MRNRFIVFGMVFLLTIISASALTTVNSCQNITSTDTYELTQNVAVGVDNVCFYSESPGFTFDCKGFTIQDGTIGFDKSLGSENSDSMDNVTIKNCNFDNVTAPISSIGDNSIVRDSNFTDWG